MEAKNTIMSGEEILEAMGKSPSGYIRNLHVAKAQAEITWKAREPEITDARKAGYQQGVEDFTECAKYFDKGKQAGIKEVVQWIKVERKCRYINDVLYYPVYEKTLQAKLKDWGIDEIK